jgi:hypothetical protein
VDLILLSARTVDRTLPLFYTVYSINEEEHAGSCILSKAGE